MEAFALASRIALLLLLSLLLFELLSCLNAPLRLDSGGVSQLALHVVDRPPSPILRYMQVIMSAV